MHESELHSARDLAVLVVQCTVGVGFVTERTLVRFPAGSLSSQLGQLSLPSPGVGKSSTSLQCMVEVKRRAFTCVGWQVTLCDPI